MKLRRWIIGITLFVAAVYGITVWYIAGQKVDTLNITGMNDVAKTAEETFKAGGGLEEVYTATDYNGQYQIILVKDRDYDKAVYQALLSRSVLYDIWKDGALVGKVIFPLQKDAEEELKSHLLRMSTLVFAGILVFIWSIGLVIYVKMMRPFLALQEFASNIAAGNFEFSLHMKRDNYFGAFTESFDLMRDELLRAKQGEYEANRSKKELVASLSHDIKTPVSTIKAYCELLLMQCKEEQVKKKIGIIDKNADRINFLISDMFHATLEELSMLKIQPEEELSTIIPPMFEEADREGLISLTSPIPECLISCDRLRLGQVIDNVLSNSYKYAHTKIEVSFAVEEKQLAVRIRDFGSGVKEEELPMICEKFCRGSNAGHAEGAGLGLYLSRQFMQGMKGGMEVYNEDGFVVVLHIPVV